MSKVSISEFPFIPATKRSISNRRKIFGIGINDADYFINPTINGKRVMCPYYKKWMAMFNRCYSTLSPVQHPTYDGCTVTSEWVLFSNFRAWMRNQSWEGKHLDKDLLYPGNKIYSPKTCLFVTRSINNLLTNHASDRGLYPQGVHFEKAVGKFRAEISISGKRKFLGYYDTPEAAKHIYMNAKRKDIMRHANQQSEPLRSALIRCSHAFASG